MERISKALLKSIRGLQHKKYRDETGLFIAEGAKCVGELMKSFELVYLITEDSAGDRVSIDAAIPAAAEQWSATRLQIEQMSSLRTPQGIIGVFKKHEGQMSGVQRMAEGDIVLALDGVQDPGNLGTIIRTCDWFGVHDIYCSPDTADSYNPKVVQATMGALSRVQVHYTDLPEWIKELKNQHSELRIYGTLLDGGDLYEVLSGAAGLSQTWKRSLVIMGNEGNGISPEVRRLVTHPVRIPSYPKDVETSESLNVSIATAVVLAEFRRRG